MLILFSDLVRCRLHLCVQSVLHISTCLGSRMFWPRCQAILCLKGSLLVTILCTFYFYFFACYYFLCFSIRNFTFPATSRSTSITDNSQFLQFKDLLPPWYSSWFRWVSSSFAISPRVSRVSSSNFLEVILSFEKNENG